MSIASNASIAQFAAAYAGALSSLGIESTAQALVSDGSITYGCEPIVQADKPLVKIDGSRSTAARDSYVLLSAPDERAFFVLPPEIEGNIFDITSPFLSDIDRLEEVLDSKTIGVTHHFAGADSEGYAVSSQRLRDVLKTLSKLSASDEYREDINHTAFKIATDATEGIHFGQRDELEIAGLFFAAGALFAGLKDEKSIERANEMFITSTAHFHKAGGHMVAKAVVAELPAKLMENDEKKRDFYLVQIADLWDEAAKGLHKDGDIVGATIAIYRGLRAASLSKNYEAMGNLFSLSAEINKEGGNTKVQTHDHLREALAALKMYEHGMTSNEQMVWAAAYWGLRFASGLAQEQQMIDTLKPFLTVAKERAGPVE